VHVRGRGDLDGLRRLLLLLLLLVIASRPAAASTAMPPSVAPILEAAPSAAATASSATLLTAVVPVTAVETLILLLLLRRPVVSPRWSTGRDRSVHCLPALCQELVGGASVFAFLRLSRHELLPFTLARRWRGGWWRRRGLEARRGRGRCF